MTFKTTLLAGVALACLATAGSAQTLRWGAARDINSLDPYSYGSTFTISFLNHVYEGLVRYNSNLEIEPALATEWEVLPNNIWRFKLRQGVKFHDGADFTADDVVTSLARVSHADSPLKGNLPAYKSATKVDDYTVDIELVGTYPLLLNDLTNIHMFDAGWLKEHNAEVPTDVAKKVEGYPTFNANGTGPFSVESRVPDSKTILAVNDGWWDTPQHNLKRIEFTPIASEATRVAALLSGEIDFTEKAPVQDLPRLAAAPNVKVMEGNELRTIMFGFNFQDKLHNGEPNLFKDKKMREAVGLAIDLNLIRDKVMRGKSRVTGTMVAPAIPGYDPALDTPPVYDPEKAAAMIKELGAEGYAFEIMCSNDLWVNEEEICNALVSMLTRVGLAPRLNIAPNAVQQVKLTNGEADMFAFGWANEPMLDSYSILLQTFQTKSDNAGVFNWGGWSYPEMDKLIIAASTELDREKRLAMQSAALKIVKDESIMLPFHQQPMAWATSDKVESVVQLSDNKGRHWLTRMAE
ncbi:ABC transporter substrate-binding protein [Gemmobacter fulvus]|uniref:ABC transporter substrate-binding protein n=1 Tax=Gemmobacter fulvus TaxID=2840474 RepID=UPI0027967D1B|nr:ABC transporter substrate-binding protein [Gemmobacter fulvus]MDQ1849678.1 ABC transporter substrate-binding protein [Gemmobacter fulvus]